MKSHKELQIMAHDVLKFFAYVVAILVLVGLFLSFAFLIGVFSSAIAHSPAPSAGLYETVAVGMLYEVVGLAVAGVVALWYISAKKRAEHATNS